MAEQTKPPSKDASQSTIGWVPLINKNLFSTKALFTTHLIDYLSQNKKQYPQHKQNIEDCQKNFRNSFLTCLALTGALALSLRRYFPSFFFALSLKTMAIDTTLVMTGLIFGTKFASNMVTVKFSDVLSKLIKDKDRQTYQQLKKFSEKYGVSQKHIASLVATNQKQQHTLHEQLIEQQKKDKKQKLI